MTPAEQAEVLSSILSYAYTGWATHWKSVSAPEDREATWAHAVRTSLAIAETAGSPAPTAEVADDPSVQRAELDEILCRRRLTNAGFLARCENILTRVGRDPDKFPRPGTEIPDDPPAAYFDEAVANLAATTNGPL